MSWRPENWETPSIQESIDWLKEAQKHYEQDRETWGKEADDGELQSARQASSVDRAYARGFEAGADAMLQALEESTDSMFIAGKRAGAPLRLKYTIENRTGWLVYIFQKGKRQKKVVRLKEDSK